MDIISYLSQPWPWYVAGPLIGLTVPTLLLIGNKSFGISSSLRHICASCFPADIDFFKYDWKKEIWNLVFAFGILIGGFIAATFLVNTDAIQLNANLIAELAKYNIHPSQSLLPTEIFSWANLFTLQGFIFMVFGGFLIGFGTRYAGGCTSGHAIMGISNLQWPSLVATCCFMAGGFLVANFIVPILLNL